MHPLNLLSCLSIALLTFVGFGATDRYVSTNAVWKSEINPAVCYSSIQAAIDAASSGDTVWVKDGYVCSEGSTEWNGGKRRIAIVGKTVTLRSESGIVDLSKGKGATIVGTPDPTGEYGLGPDAVACIGCAINKAIRIVGFRLTGGRTCPYEKVNGWKAYGGGICFSGSLENCLVDNCAAGVGGGVSINNNSGEIPTLLNCVVSNNLSNTQGGGGVRQCICRDSTIVGNVATNVEWTAAGAGVHSGMLTNCVVKNNRAYGSSSRNQANGGGVYNAPCYGCRIVGNYAANTGGGWSANGCEGANNVIMANLAGMGEGAVAGAGVCYNMLIVANTNENVSWSKSSMVAGTANVTKLYNCTIADNVSSKGGCSGVSNAGIVNTIIWNNSHMGISSATNSCAKGLDDGLGPKNISEDPKFVGGKGADGYCLKVRSPCWDAGLELPWMKNKASVLSRDFRGKRRILGAGPDIGASEFSAYGIQIIVR